MSSAGLARFAIPAGWAYAGIRYQSQIDGHWRFAAPLSFSLASPSNGRPIVGQPFQKE
jgi:hypothetical protein